MTFNKNTTQFFVALLGTVGLSVVTCVSTTLWLLGYGTERGEFLVGMLAGGLVSTVSAAAAWLFRVNGHTPPS